MPARLDPSQIPAAPNLEFEQDLWLQAVRYIAGLDEAGRGAWAGPVMAGAVILPPSTDILKLLEGVRDSKELSPARRADLAPVICNHAFAWAVGESSAAEIDALGILPATRLAMQRALRALAETADHLLIDALFLPDVDIPQTALIKGDQRSLSIAAASILAKTSRDAWMCDCETLYPQYGFSRHKGYGTSLHQQRLKSYGPSAIHRRSFAPIRALLGEENMAALRTG
jgi:ribonuclease HII